MGGVPWRLIGAIFVTEGAGGIGALFTRDGLERWYPALKKPSFNPPNGVFGPVWTTLYAMMGTAEYLVARRGSKLRGSEEIVRRAERLFAVQLGLNVGWSLLFFRLRSPLAALIELVVLLGAIVLTIQAFARVSRVAVLLLLPYLLWSMFAAVLNGAIWWLNRDRPAN